LTRESLEASLADGEEWATYWLVNPLDGVWEFLTRGYKFTVDIALMHEHEPVLEIMYAPALQLCYFASEDAGVFKQAGVAEPTPLRVRARALGQGRKRALPPVEPMACLQHLDEHELKSAGSSLKFLLDEHEEELESHIKLPPEWEAAAHCLVDAADATALQWLLKTVGETAAARGEPLPYNEAPFLPRRTWVNLPLSFASRRPPARLNPQPVSSSQGIYSMPIAKDPSRYLKPAVALALEAGRKIMEIYRSDFRVGRKPDDSPLTAADLAAHHCLVEGLHSLNGSSYPILSEEAADTPFEERSKWETYWLIDPLDGTKEFIKRNDEFTVNIALIHRHKPVLGVVYAPALEICYFGSEGCGAFKRTGAKEPVQIYAYSRARHPLVVVGSRSHASPETETYLHRLGEYQLKSIGSSLKFCLVAEGAADIYPRMGPTSEWDTAAAQCVVEAAGGAVRNLRNETLAYNAKPSLLNPYFLVFGDHSRNWTEQAWGIEG
jgi:3'(2'), 5'-bisphosphate nucleotidase